MLLCHSVSLSLSLSLPLSLSLSLSKVSVGKYAGLTNKKPALMLYIISLPLVSLFLSLSLFLFLPLSLKGKDWRISYTDDFFKKTPKNMPLCSEHKV